MLYHILAWCSRRGLQWCYRDAQMAGRIPDTGPLLLAVNHANDLPDICAVLAHVQRRVTFVANVTLTEQAVARWAYRQMGVVPVHRVRDARRARARGEDSALANAHAFVRVREVLAAGGCVCVFPEGGVNRGTHLAPLRTGLARMALDARDDAGIRGLKIVPIGLTFEAPTRLRSRMLIEVGEPVDMDVWRASADRPLEPQLTAEIASRLRSVTRNAPDESSADMLRTIASVIAAASGSAMPMLDGSQAWRAVVGDTYGPGIAPALADDTRLVAVADLAKSLRALAASPERPLLAWRTRRNGASTTPLAWWQVPLALCGLLLHAPAWWLNVVIARRIALTPAEIIPRLIVPGLYLMALWYVLLGTGIVLLAGRLGVPAYMSVVAALCLTAVVPSLGDWGVRLIDMLRDRWWVRQLQQRVPNLATRVSEAVRAVQAMRADAINPSPSGDDPAISVHAPRTSASS